MTKPRDDFRAADLSALNCLLRVQEELPNVRARIQHSDEKRATIRRDVNALMKLMDRALKELLDER